MSVRETVASPRQLQKRVYLFEEGNATLRDLLGGKGAGLAEMTRTGVPVPPGFTITTAVCLEYMRLGNAMPPGLMDEVHAALAEVERRMGRRFGDPADPLLVSVRSGAKFSMPGMMDTILNLGLTDETVQGLAARGDRRFAYDSYRRFVQMFGNVVLGVKHGRFEAALADLKARAGAAQDTDLGADDLMRLVAIYKELIRTETGSAFPETPAAQLEAAIDAVFRSWDNPRAITYRNANRIAHDLGTAVNVQAMVFGNMGWNSGTGVAFTRDPATGERGIYGEYLLNAQGEDVVAGIRTPKALAELQREMPEVYAQFVGIAEKLERHYRDVQDVEFTIERGALWMLQTRAGKRTAQAAVKIAVDMVHEGLIDKATALLRVDADQLTTLLHRRIDPAAPADVVARGLPASPGAAVGEVVFDPDEAERLGRDGRRLILVRPETNPDDIHGLIAAQGVVTSRGGMTSHAAIVARGMGKPAVVGVESLEIDEHAGVFHTDGREIRAGDVITVDGSAGRVIVGAVPLIDPSLAGEPEELLRWADEVRTIGVRANADYPRDAAKAREFGAEGIGLVRTEHMFMEADRLPIMQEMILASTEADRRAALAKLLPMQRGDFEGIFRVMHGLPVTIRLLDPPLHEFLPKYEELLVEIAERRARGEIGGDFAARERLLHRVEQLREFNPMLGTRGARLGLLYPEINEMQTRAIFEAAVAVAKEGVRPIPEVMIPLIGTLEELARALEPMRRLAEEITAAAGVEIPYSFGTMIEIPRACLVADQIAREAEFFSFGTNDLTQTIFGFSRDDAEAKFLQAYLERGILKENPFEVLDQPGVGRLMEIAIELGRRTRPDLKIGICGEHGGDPRSVEFCHRIGLDYVSPSPYRVPVARLAGAHAAIKKQPSLERDV